MDRLGKVHRASRVPLPNYVVDRDEVIAIDLPKRWLQPKLSYFLAIAGFMTCGGFIVAAAGFLALNIQ